MPRKLITKKFKMVYNRETSFCAYGVVGNTVDF